MIPNSIETQMVNCCLLAFVILCNPRPPPTYSPRVFDAAVVCKPVKWGEEMTVKGKNLRKAAIWLNIFIIVYFITYEFGRHLEKIAPQNFFVIILFNIYLRGESVIIKVTLQKNLLQNIFTHFVRILLGFDAKGA